MKKNLVLIFLLFLSMNAFSQLVKEFDCGFSTTFPAGYKETMIDNFSNDNWDLPSFRYLINWRSAKLDSLAKEKVKAEKSVNAGTDAEIKVLKNQKYKAGNTEGWLLVYEKAYKSDATLNYIYVIYYFNNTNTATGKTCNVQLMTYTPTAKYQSGNEAIINAVLASVKK